MNLVLVEGSDDQNLLVNVLYAHGFEQAPRRPGEFAIVQTGTGQRVQFKSKDGYREVARTFHVEMTLKDLDRIAVVVDADSDVQARRRSVAGFLQTAGYPDVESQSWGSGLIIQTEGLPTLGVWLMPDNSQVGYIEHFLAGMIPQGDSLWPLAQSGVSSIPPEERRFTDVHRGKAEIHTWLAWQKEPGSRLAEAVKRQYVDPQSDTVTKFVDWFNRWLDT